MSVNVSAVTNHFPTANKGFITTTSSTITSGVAQTTVPLTSVSGLTNATIFVGILSPGTASEREFTGTVDTAGSQITGVKWTDGLDATHTAGTTIVDYVAATGQNMQTKGFLVAHDQDGTLKADSVDVTAVIKDGVITNAKLVDGTITEAKTNTKPSEFLADFIYSGGVVAQSAGLVGTFSNIVYYIAGVRYTATSVANKTYTASKDTYVDIGTDGTVDYNEAANNAASPALAASHIRVAIVTTNGSAITNVNQGEETQLVPIASSIPYAVTDSLGNLICPRDPNCKLLGLRIKSVNQSGITTVTDLTGLSCTFIAPTSYNKVKVSFKVYMESTVAGDVVRATLKEGSTAILSGDCAVGTAAKGQVHFVSGWITPTAGTHTYKMTVERASGTGTVAVVHGACSIAVERS